MKSHFSILQRYNFFFIQENKNLFKCLCCRSVVFHMGEKDFVSKMIYWFQFVDNQQENGLCHIKGGIFSLCCGW